MELRRIKLNCTERHRLKKKHTGIGQNKRQTDDVNNRCRHLSSPGVSQAKIMRRCEHHALVSTMPGVTCMLLPHSCAFLHCLLRTPLRTGLPRWVLLWEMATVNAAQNCMTQKQKRVAKYTPILLRQAKSDGKQLYWQLLSVLRKNTAKQNLKNMINVCQQ